MNKIDLNNKRVQYAIYGAVFGLSACVFTIIGYKIGINSVEQVIIDMLNK